MFEDIPIDRLKSCRALSLEEQAELLINVIVHEFFLRPADDTDDVPQGLRPALKMIDGRETFRECLESICRPRSKKEVQRLAETLVLKLCERIRPVDS